jgi:phosphate ABC transporter phosphate-binding protein
MTARSRFLAFIAPVVLVLGAALATAPATTASAADYVAISGAGSTWSSNAIDQWRRNVQQYGMSISYAATGSSDGRNQFKAGTVDFASSEIPYGQTDNGVVDAPPSRGYAYLPIVAGGTSFMYNLQVGGRKITNLRLSGETLTKIFTGRITSWNDPAIKADNPGLTIPKLKIIPVVRSDGSGSTAQFATWMASQYPSLWNAYCAKAGRSTPCGVTSNYPTVAGSGFIAQPGSQGVSGYVAQTANVGTITYVEYSYALNTNYPVAKILNKAGYYVEPTASNVAVGLLKAKINEDKSSPNYLTQILTGVYNNPDPRTYPLSSYSYMIVPTRVEANFSTDKGKTLGAFTYYYLCEGQQQAEVLGYSPLPINLVKAGLAQVKRIPGVQAQSIDITKCNNPTFSKSGENLLAKNAPQPSACDKKGATQCTTGTGGAKGDTPNSGGGTTNPGTGGTSNPGTGGTSNPGTGGATDPGTGGTTDPGTGGTTDPGTGGTTDPGTGGTGGSVVNGPTEGAGPIQCDSDTGVCQNVVALPVEVASSTEWSPSYNYFIAGGLALIALIVVPSAIGIVVSRRRKS